MRCYSFWDSIAVKFVRVSPDKPKFNSVPVPGPSPDTISSDSKLSHGPIRIRKKARSTIERRHRSRCRRGGFLYEPANPPRKIIVSDASGPAANCLRRIAVHITKPAGQKKNRQEPAKSRVANNAPPSLSSTAPSVFPGAHARPPAALALAVTLQPFSSASKVSSPARTSFLFPQGECWICSSGSHECDWFMVEFLISKSLVSLLARCARLLLVASRRDSN